MTSYCGSLHAIAYCYAYCNYSDYNMDIDTDIDAELVSLWINWWLYICIDIDMISIYHILLCTVDCIQGMYLYDIYYHILAFMILLANNNYQ